MDKLRAFFLSKNLYMSIIAIVIMIIVYLVVKNIINKYVLKNNAKLNKKKETYIRLLKNILKYAIIIILVILLLEINGVNVTSIIAGLGLVSVIAGLALQDALKDIIMGFNIIVDDYYSVGDVIKIGDVEGKVISLGLKATKIQDINNGNILVIANRNISQALLTHNKVFLTVPLPYELSLKDAKKVIDKMIKEILKLDDVTNAEFKGIDEFADSQIVYKITITTKCETKLMTKRNANMIIKEILDKEKIDIPYMQVDIHNKK